MKRLSVFTRLGLLESLYCLFGCTLLILIFLKAYYDVDFFWDSWWYHLPFAARIWHIFPSNAYILNPFLYHRFQGFGLLAEFWQGLFWVIFHRIQGANLVAWASLSIYLLFLQKYFKVPFYYTAIALLAVPLIQIHAGICYNDLFGNIFLAILALLTFCVYTRPGFLNRGNILVILVSAFFSANTKLLLVPITAFLLLLIIGKSVYEIVQSRAMHCKWTRHLTTIILLWCIACPIIFLTCTKNTLIYHNPVYPIQVPITGKLLPYKENYYHNCPEAIKNFPNPVKWLYSLMEINRPLLKWSNDEFLKDSSADRTGGYFYVYVIFQLALFLIQVLKFPSVEKKWALAFFGANTILVACSPQSFELRYYMYWIIILISFNLYFLLKHTNALNPPRRIVFHNICGINLIFFLVAALGLQFEYILPHPKQATLNKLIQIELNNTNFSGVTSQANICAAYLCPYDLLLIHPFHPYTPFYTVYSPNYFLDDHGKGQGETICPAPINLRYQWKIHAHDF